LLLQLLYEERSFKYYIMFRLLAFTGLRKGELLALHWSDIDFENKPLRLRKTLADPRGEIILQTPKSLASRRIISLDDTTLSSLTRWRGNQIEEYAESEVELEDDQKQLIFSRFYNRTKQFGFFRLAHLNDKLYYFLKHHPDLPSITMHRLRHTHASLLF